MQNWETTLATHYHLALYTVGIFKKPADDRANEGFHIRNDPLLKLVDSTHGMIARSGYDGEPGPVSWGIQVYPRFYIEQGDGYSPSTLSVWRDLESAFAFIYFGLHAEALALGREWFKKPEWPPYVFWWVKAGDSPTWTEAVVRHEYLHDKGPSAFAFNFKTAFDAGGLGFEINLEHAKEIAHSNSSTKK